MGVRKMDSLNIFPILLSILCTTNEYNIRGMCLNVLQGVCNTSEEYGIELLMGFTTGNFSTSQVKLLQNSLIFFLTFNEDTTLSCALSVLTEISKNETCIMIFIEEYNLLHVLLMLLQQKIQGYLYPIYLRIVTIFENILLLELHEEIIKTDFLRVIKECHFLDRDIPIRSLLPEDLDLMLKGHAVNCVFYLTMYDISIDYVKRNDVKVLCRSFMSIEIEVIRERAKKIVYLLEQ